MTDERGSAVVLAMWCALLLSALGAALVFTTSAETMIAANFRIAASAQYAAEAAASIATIDLRGAADWAPVFTGASQSSFADGAPGVRVLADGSSIDLVMILNAENCAKTTPCSSSDMDSVTADRPWGAANPRWHLYAYGRAPVAGSGTPPYYLVVLAAEDRANAAAGHLLLRAEAFGARGAHQAIDAVLTRDIVTEPAAVRVLSWREVR
jgi:hypothetical protein